MKHTVIITYSKPWFVLPVRYELTATDKEIIHTIYALAKEGFSVTCENKMQKS